MRAMAAAMMLVTIFLVAACSDQKTTSGDQGKAKPQNNTPKTTQVQNQKPKTVVVNEGMSKKQERKLNQRLADLEGKVKDKPAGKTNGPSKQPPEQQPAPAAKSTADYALSAARDYYAAASAGEYSYTYGKLGSYAQGQFTEDEWIADNTALGSDAASYSVGSVNMVDDSTADVNLTITSPDGSSSDRSTRFVFENGGWKHDLTQAEYDLFANATGAPATSPANADAKSVKVVISSDKPADISISDDSLDWFVNEEITGSKTYERDITRNSGMSVSAITDAYNAEVAIKVYENGSLVAQDSDSHGSATVTY